MLDLKAQLLGAGIVSEDQVKKVEAEQEKEREKKQQRRESFDNRRPGKGPQGMGPKGKGPNKGPHKGKSKGKSKGPRKPAPAEFDAERWQKRVAALAEEGKSEQYDVIRNWVRRTRIDDPKAVLSEEAERFHFTKYDGQISWLSLEPALAEKLKKNEAAISAFMGFNGLEHGMFPVDMASDIGKIRPEWVRHMDGWTPRLKEEDDRIATAIAAKEAEEAIARGETPADLKKVGEDGKATEGQAAETKSDDVKPDAGEPTEVQATESQAAETKNDDVKPDADEPTEVQATESQAAETKNDDVKPDADKPAAGEA
ncbi:MAG: hypothetical protein GY822_27595, partial [Deltaproteobacteria bacterium]|nr:hypothetical protein [Deltaproteobacteria bacterium]